MKTKIIILVLCILSSKAIIAQDETGNDQSSISVETSYIGDAMNNFLGGLKKGNTYLGSANIKLSFDTEKAKLWQGGEFFINAANTHGGNPSAKFIGDYQVASNIEAGDLTYMHELWLKQKFGKATIVAGLQDLCTEFISSEHASLYLNSSFGVPSSIATNLSVPIFPLTSIGAQLHYEFSEKFAGKIAVFDGVPDDFSVNRYNISWNLNKNDGFISFAEFSYNTSNDQYPATYKLGGYYHNKHNISTINENQITTVEHSENYGFYLIADQTLIKYSNGKEISCFIQASGCPKNYNDNHYYCGSGINFKGLISKRNEDLLGVAVAHAGLNAHPANETTLEMTYKAQVGKHIFIQPDLQYIINPSGIDEKQENALVGFLRIGITF